MGGPSKHTAAVDNSPTSALSPDDSAPRRYWIPPHVRACATATGTIVLDLKRSLYFALGVKETRALLALDAQKGRANMTIWTSLEPMTLDLAARMAKPLVQAGLLSEAPSIDPLPVAQREPGTTLTTLESQLDYSVAVRPADGIRFLQACLWARKAARVRTLYAVACEIAGQKRQSSGHFDVSRAVEQVGLFRRFRPFAFAAKDQCLFHALALVKFLSYYELFPTWIIGVRPRPWAAHSWVQQGNVLFDENPEHIYEYTPILVV